MKEHAGLFTIGITGRGASSAVILCASSHSTQRRKSSPARENVLRIAKSCGSLSASALRSCIWRPWTAAMIVAFTTQTSHSWTGSLTQFRRATGCRTLSSRRRLSAIGALNTDAQRKRAKRTCANGRSGLARRSRSSLFRTCSVLVADRTTTRPLPRFAISWPTIRSRLSLMTSNFRSCGSTILSKRLARLFSIGRPGIHDARVAGSAELTVTQLLVKLQAMRNGYFEQNTVPNLADRFDANLYTTFMSHIDLDDHCHRPAAAYGRPRPTV